MTLNRRFEPAVIAVLFVMLALPAFGDEDSSNAGETSATQTKSFLYKAMPRRTLTVYCPDDWQPTDTRPALVIFRCNIPAQREHFRRLGMVIIKPQLAPVNSGQLPKLSLDEIAALPRPRNQVEDSKSVIRYLRANTDSLGIDPHRIVATGTSGGGDLALQSCINRSFQDSNDDQSISHRPDALVLYCPAFDGIDIWFVKTDALLERTKIEAPSFVPHLPRFARMTPEGYSVPLDHRASLIKLASQLGQEEGVADAEIAQFQKVLELFNARDWQLLHPVEDALKMSASRILPKEPLPSTMILFGDRDHLSKYQNAFVDKARAAGKQFELKVYKGGGHSFMTQPAFEKPSTQDVEAFLKQHGYLPAVATRKKNLRTPPSDDSGPEGKS
jgi:acetyl esterase/lipase